ncbi:MAG: D-alanyl-D-alanine carboxypeptidase/D-alanyl-D-alanine-endopeptidase [Polyangiaceae bacterium]|nr:D-alanyl-D-alanine carboxypeptidase/D-alanyl-D-alanine-endopeptidase [Polyangiaceae bacterium]
MRPTLLALLLAIAPAGYATGTHAEPAPPPAPARAAGEAQKELDRLAAWAEREKGELSAQVIEVATRRVVAEKNPGLPLNPASNAKVPTAAAVLARMGADHRFKSGLYGELKDGVVPRLVLRSNGDPTLSSRDLDKWVKELVDAGLKRVADIQVDQSAFDARFVPPAFEQQPAEWAPFRAPVSAVSLDRNAFVVRVVPAKLGEPAQASVDPAGFVDVDGKVLSEKKGKTLVVEMRPSGGALAIRLSGHVSKPTSFVKRVDDPRLFAAHVLRAQLKRRGVVVDGGVGEGGKDETRVLVEKTSEPLSVILRDVGKHSDNFTAEMLLKALGGHASRRAGASADGAAAVTEWLKSAGAADPGTRIVNGSGLFDANRLSAASLVSAQVAASNDPKTGVAFVEQLAVGGIDGTLRNRFKQLKKKLRGKTGTLARATSLSGVVLGADGRPRLAFAVVINGIAGKADEQRRRIDRVVEKAAAERR